MDGGLASEPETRPGTKFYAPQARLVTENGEPITIQDQPITPDIVSASVTLVNSGVSQASVVLNNQRHDASHRPVAPIWRYNKMDTVSFGQRMRVDMRYGSEGWTPMILARITDAAFLFPSTAGAQLTLKGEDLLSLLKTKPAEDKIYENKHEIAMVEEELTISGSSLSLPTPRPAPLFAETLPTLTHQKKNTHLQFIDTLAQRMDYEVFVAFDNTSPGQAGANPTAPDPRPVSLHFEPGRSETLGEFVTLQWGRDIVDFKPTFKVWDVLTDAVANGSPPRGRGTFSAAVTLGDAINDLHTAEGGDAPINAADARENAFDEENRPAANSEQISVSNIDEERATRQATAALRKSAREFLTVELTTIGFPKLRPGIHVNLTGFYAPFDGIYYVTKTVHSLSAAGYVTKTTLRRPGMLDPSDYPSE